MVALVSIVWLDLNGLFGSGVAIGVNGLASVGVTVSMGVPIFAIAVPGGVVVVVVAFGMHWNATNALYELFFCIALVIPDRGLILVLEERRFAATVFNIVAAASGVLSLIGVLMVG